MRIAVIGAGAIGGALAALLDRAGNDVEITARGAGLAAIKAGGIRLSGQWGEHVARVAAGERLSRRPEIAIVATKAVDAPAAIQDNLEWLGGIPVVVVQNGLSGISAAVAAAPKSDIVGGLAVFAASFLEPGVVTVTTGGPLYVGVGVDQSDIPARFVAQVLGTVLDTRFVPDFAGAQWTKLIVNQVNAIPAITGLSVQAVISDGGLRRAMTASIRENVRVARARGIRFAPMNGLGNGMLRLIGAVPLWIGQLLPLAMRRRMGSVPNPGSTQQSILRGQPTEIDYLNGAVVEAAAGTGVPTPVNAALVAMVHEVETSGQFLPVSEVVARAR
ncbi:MAG: 2-dehydropantoate 2-reductase [Actinomycetota bacterium]